MELRLYIRQNAVYNLIGQQIYYDGTAPQNLMPIIGTLPIQRQWANYGNFIDITDDVSDLHGIELSWTIQRDNTGKSVSQRAQIQRSATGMITMTGEAYNLLKSWLIDDVSASINSVEVMIRDSDCGDYRGYVILPNDIQWCEDGICQYSVVLKQQDEQIACIKRTIISDNWQGWFPTDGVPANNKKHPRFSYCKQPFTSGTMMAIWYILYSLYSSVILTAILPMILIINSILLIVIAITSILKKFGLNVNVPSFISLNDLFEGLSVIMIQSAGCGREHPAPLVRDYITNVCDKCGVIVNEQTAPTLFAKQTTINASHGVVTEDNDYYNMCYFNAPVRRGIRRFEKANLITGFSSPSNEYWIDDNRPLLSLDGFLDQICYILNHEWRVINGELHIRRKDEMNQVPYVYDFTKGSPDREKIVNGICYNPTGEKFPASMVGIYIPDSSDLSGNEAGNVNGTGQMNSIVGFVATDNDTVKAVNPNFDGMATKQSVFSATRFRHDGVSNDYIYDSLQNITNGSMFDPITGMIFWNIVTNIVAKELDYYSSYALLLSAETAVNPKLLIWDGKSYENARCIIKKGAWDGRSQYPEPEIEPYYNTNLKQWKELHYPQTDVQGRKLTLAASPTGIYEVQDRVGIVLAQKPALLVNYPMFFNANFKGNLWDRFHWIDDPNRNPVMNYDWEVKLELCCEDIKKIKATNYASDIVLHEKVKLPFGLYQTGTIKEIKISYKPDDEYGRYIELKGKL